MPQLAQCRELGEAKKPEGVAMLRIASNVLITSARAKRLDADVAARLELNKLPLEVFFAPRTCYLRVARRFCAKSKAVLEKAPKLTLRDLNRCCLMTTRGSA